MQLAQYAEIFFLKHPSTVSGANLEIEKRNYPKR